MLQIGCVKYLNARPLIHGWADDVVLDHPRALCARLAAGELDVALVSSFEFLRNPIYKIADDVAINSAGPVYSVFVAYRGELSAIEEIELDPASETSINLLRCLLAERGLNPRLIRNTDFQSVQPAKLHSIEAKRADKMSADRTGKMPVFRPPPRRAQLLIGDQAIEFRQKQGADIQFWDLGEAWSEVIGLPFVFALWLVRPEVKDASGIARQLRSIRDTNLTRIEEIAAGEKRFPKKFCEWYLRDCLRFNFGEREKSGLRKFGELCVKQKLLPQNPLNLDLV